MVKEETMTVYEAVNAMRAISNEGGTFSFKFRKCNRKTGVSGECASVARARLRPRAHDEDVTHAEYKIFFTDVDTGEPKVCWLPLIVSFNGKKVILT